MDKCCTKCKVVKPNACFHKCKTTKDGLHAHCKECKAGYRLNCSRGEYNKRYYENNKDKVLAKNKEYRMANADDINAQRKLYRERNAEHIKEKRKEYLPIRKANIKERRQVDDNFRLREILRSKVHKMLNNKPTSYMNLIGCDLTILRSWLEYQFDKDMSWDNLGTYWQIDHILPMSRFNLTSENEQRICFSWTNLQPLHKTENRKKSNRLELHYYFNSLITLHRFIQYKNGPYSGYQSKNESLCWLRNQLR